MTAVAEARATEFLRQGWWRSGTFLDDLRRQARERPHKTAVAARRVAASRTETLDYAELSRLTDRFAGALRELGVRHGDYVAVVLPNRWEIVPLVFACMAVGAVIVPIQPDTPEAELRHRLGMTGARVCVTIPEWAGEPLAETVVGLKAELAGLAHVVVVDGRPTEGARDFHEHFVDVPWEERHDLAGEALGPDEPYVVLFTSGTTGESKGVLHSQNTLYAALRGYVEALELDERWVAAVTSPLVHYSGFAQGLLTGVLVGGTIAFQDVKDPDALLELVERHRATLLYGPPSTMAAVLAAQRAKPRDVRSLRNAVIGTAAVLPRLVVDLREVLGVKSHSLWGMSEFGPVTLTRADDPEEAPGFSNGRTITGMEVRIDPTGLPGDGSIGRLWTRGASRALGYFKRQDVFDAGLDPQGWFDTGDLARHDGRGGIRIVCRAKDAVVRDGHVVPAVEVEAVLESHPLVGEAALVGLPGDVLCAVVVPGGERGPSLEELRGHARAAGLDDRFRPDRVELVDALPKTLTGKIRKAVLRERYGAA
ncbi:AMP-binding protein [Saccharothrix hoggarensis]|uniref:AMP-binding protein n=1 Tax=Saccharothrix hoggarensis TaxID=913853 RepID=A0ABW3R039_9PSEU